MSKWVQRFRTTFRIGTCRRSNPWNDQTQLRIVWDCFS